MTTKIKVLIVDDDPIIRLTTLAALQCAPDVEVVAEAADGQEAVAKSVVVNPDVILMDLMMPVMDGVQASRKVLAQQRGARIVAFTSLEVDDMVLSAIHAGVRGYLHKPASPEALLQAVRSVHGGKLFFPAELTRELLGIAAAS